MLIRNNQMKISFSEYKELYNILIPQDNKWRRMNDEIDFSFVYDYLQDSYSANMGRTSKDVVFMFKLLLLKTESGLSDEGLIKMVNVNMEYKYFLGLDPEEKDIIDSSLLNKFRRSRIAKYEKDENNNNVKVMDKSQELMDILISKTVDLAITKGIIKKRNMKGWNKMIKEIVKDVKKMAEEAKVAVRNVRREGIDKAKADQKAGDMTEDELKGAENEIQKLTDKYVEEIDKIAEAKEKEVMSV